MASAAVAADSSVATWVDSLHGSLHVHAPGPLRKKGRDLFDLWQALSQLSVDDDQVVELFTDYLRREGQRVTRAQFERNLTQKERMPEFLGDILPLLPTGVVYDPTVALALVRTRLIERLPGKAWRAPDEGGA